MQVSAVFCQETGGFLRGASCERRREAARAARVPRQPIPAMIPKTIVRIGL